MSYLPMDASVYPGVKWIISARFLFPQSISFSPRYRALQLHRSQISVPKIDLNISEVDAPVSFSLRGCLYGRLDETFVGEAGRDFCWLGTLFIAYLRENASTHDHISRDDFTQDNLESQHNVVPVTWNGFLWKTSLQTYFHINGMVKITDIYMHVEIPFKVQSWKNSPPPLPCKRLLNEFEP